MTNITLSDIKRIVGKEGCDNNEFANWLVGVMVEAGFYNKINAEECTELGNTSLAKSYRSHGESLVGRADKLYNTLEYLGYYN